MDKDRIAEDPTCDNCAKGITGRNCCPVIGKVQNCAVHEWPGSPSHVPAQQDKQSRVPPALIPSVVPTDVAALTVQILHVWALQGGAQVANDKTSHHRFAIVSKFNPALGPSFNRYRSRVQELVSGCSDDDMLYVSWALSLLSPGARKEYRQYCERVELQYAIKTKRKKVKAMIPEFIVCQRDEEGRAVVNIPHDIACWIVGQSTIKEVGQRQSAPD